jgi:hypothetical protein
MAGHSRSVISGVLWPDAEIDTISIAYDEVVINLTESSQKKTIVRCKGYIGYITLGFWDDVIVAKAELRTSDDLLDACLHSLRQRYGDELPDSGDPIRNRRTYHILEIQLIDGAVLKIVAADFVAE